jgi:hypothetical protein
MKILTQPTIPIADMTAAMREVYEPQGIAVEIASTETLNLPLQTDPEVGECKSSITAYQTALFGNRNNVGVDETVVYFCNTVSNVAAEEA